MQPTAKVILGNGNLGRVPASEDGTCGLIVSGVAVGGNFALGDVMEFKTLADAEAKGIDEAYDTTNEVLAWNHIKAFYDQAPEGTSLFVMVVDPDTTVDDICDKANPYAKKLLTSAEGKIKLIGITFTPDPATYTPSYTNEIDNAIANAIDKLQELLEEEFDLFRPCRGIIELRDWQGTVANTLDLRDVSTSPEANRVQLMLGQDLDVAALDAFAETYAAVGLLLGKHASNPVQRNCGRVKDGSLGIDNVGFSNNGAFSTLTETQLDTLNDKGYVFFRKHAGFSGFYFNDDHMATPLTDDYAYMSLGRTIDKAARITRRIYADEILNEIATDPTTGKLPIVTCKHYQGIIEKAINEEMTNKGEIAKVTAYVDPNQNVVTTSKLSIKENILPVGTARLIETTLAYESAA
jgi:hypothetical protein